MKKAYVSPSIKTEQVEIGVFGCYGGNYRDGYDRWSWDHRETWHPFGHSHHKRMH